MTLFCVFTWPKAGIVFCKLFYSDASGAYAYDRRSSTINKYNKG